MPNAYNERIMSTPQQRRRVARWVIITLVVAWIGMLLVIGVDLVELKQGGPPRLESPDDTTPTQPDQAESADES